MIKHSFFNQMVWLSFFLLGLIGFTSHASAQEEIFSFNNFSVSLPEGWVAQDISQGSEKELIGSFKSRDIPGTSILIFCYKGQYNYSSVRIVGLKTIASVFPKGQEMLKKETKVKTDGGLAAVVELWKGVADETGASAFLQVPMGIIETKTGWILMLGFTPDATGLRLENAFMKMIQSAKQKPSPPRSHSDHD